MPNTQRYFVELSYHGGKYHGWQIQPNATTVQQLLNQALSTLLRQPIDTTGCGRTDTGVHATQFYAHFDAEVNQPDVARLCAGLNALLPHDIAIKHLLPMHAHAHARFDASQRAYQYHIHFNKNPFLQGLSWQLRDMPNIQAMNAAAKHLLGQQDFGCFSKAHTQVKTNNCDISRAEWILQPDGRLVFYITADRFLRNMVRAIVGTLMEVGRGEITPEEILSIIQSKNRSNAGASVPACGLYLTEVRYPYTVS